MPLRNFELFDHVSIRIAEFRLGPPASPIENVKVDVGRAYTFMWAFGKSILAINFVCKCSIQHRFDEGIRRKSIVKSVR